MQVTIKEYSTSTRNGDVTISISEVAVGNNNTIRVNNVNLREEDLAPIKDKSAIAIENLDPNTRIVVSMIEYATYSRTVAVIRRLVVLIVHEERKFAG